MRTMTRREVIEAWNKNEKYHDFYVCPNCRDILTIVDDKYLTCLNSKCNNQNSFDILTGAKYESKNN